MKALILGGTRFIGRHIAEALVEAGHEVAVFNRGKTPDALPDGVERLRGDRNDGLAGLEALRGREWDACIDVCGYTPKQVRPVAELLAHRVGRYVYVSAVSVYVDSDVRPVRETHPREAPAVEDVTEIDASTYGPLKVACEDLVESIYGGRSVLLRPQIVVGPHDPSGRYTYWVRRAMSGGEMLAPGDGTDFLQVIDVQDLARFAVTVVEDGLSGAFNLAGPRFTWSEFIRMLGVPDVVWVPAALLEAAEVTWMELPLYRPNGSESSSLMDVSCERALEYGLSLSSPAATFERVRATLVPEQHDPLLSPEREAELISRFRGKASR